jgi:electron transport complex protein RnfG
MVGIDKEGKIRGLYFLSNGETPGLGANVANKDYTDKFTDKSQDHQIDDVDDLTAATYSSKGLKKACDLAVETYTVRKGEIFR